MPSSILHRGLAAAVSLILCHCAAAGEDALKIAIGQRGGWEQCVSELGQNAVAAYRETLDWLYSSPDAIKAYAAWSGLAERLAKQAPVFITRDSLDPIRIVGLEDMMVDAVKFKYIPAPLSTEQLAALVQVPR